MTDEMKNIKMQEIMGKKVSKRTVATIKAYLFLALFTPFFDDDDLSDCIRG